MRRSPRSHPANCRLPKPAPCPHCRIALLALLLPALLPGLAGHPLTLALTMTLALAALATLLLSIAVARRMADRALAPTPAVLRTPPTVVVLNGDRWEVGRPRRRG